MQNLDQYPVESHLTATQAHTFSRGGGWWSGIVKSEDKYGNERIRFYLWRDPDGKDWDIVHKWNITPDRWEQEKTVVEKYLNKQPTHNNPNVPVQHYHVVGGETIERNDEWWTSIVQYKKNKSQSTHDTRLYMWKLGNDGPKGTGFKWNIESDSWHEESTIAEAYLYD